MDLDEFLFYLKKKDPKHTDKEFARKMGITASHLSRIRRGTSVPSSKISFLLDRESLGKVDVLQIIRDFYNKQDI